MEDRLHSGPTNGEGSLSSPHNFRRVQAAQIVLSPGDPVNPDGATLPSSYHVRNAHPPDAVRRAVVQHALDMLHASIR